MTIAHTLRSIADDIENGEIVGEGLLLEYLYSAKNEGEEHNYMDAVFAIVIAGDNVRIQTYIYRQ